MASEYRPDPRDDVWPALPLEAWRDTYTTLHMWTQIVGKVRLALSPMINHWWHTTLYVTSRGLSTSAIPYGTRSFQIDFDLIDHNLDISASTGDRLEFRLQRMTVAEFYRRTMNALRTLGIDVSIWPVPVEVQEAIPFEQDDKHASYNPEYVSRFWRVLVQVDRVFKDFRSRFIGKVSPVHFFWGAFDLAVTRFSGRKAPEHPGGAPNVGPFVMREAYSHEVSSAGFWPGGAGVEEAAFYSYAYPEPRGFKEYPVGPRPAYYHDQLREFILTYETVRRAEDPDRMLLRFLQSAYEAAANLGQWDRAELERAPVP